jgi:hypothetical protein
LIQVLRAGALVLALATAGITTTVANLRSHAAPPRPAAEVHLSGAFFAAERVDAAFDAAAQPVTAQIAAQQNLAAAGTVQGVAAAVVRASRPTPSPAPTASTSTASTVPAPQAPAPPPPAGSIQGIITQAFTPYGSAAVTWGLRVAKCESGYNPNAYNAAGPYYGLFQFLMSTFLSTASAAGLPYGSGDILNPVANATTAAWKYAHGGASAWGCN